MDSLAVAIFQAKIAHEANVDLILVDSKLDENSLFQLN